MAQRWHKGWSFPMVLLWEVPEMAFCDATCAFMVESIECFHDGVVHDPSFACKEKNQHHNSFAEQTGHMRIRSFSVQKARIGCPVLAHFGEVATDSWPVSVIGSDHMAKVEEGINILQDQSVEGEREFQISNGLEFALLEAFPHLALLAAFGIAAESGMSCLYATIRAFG